MLNRPPEFLVRKGSPAATEVVVYPDTFLSLALASAEMTPAETAGALLGAIQIPERGRLRFVVRTIATVGLVPSGLGLSLDRDEWEQVCSSTLGSNQTVVGWFYADAGMGIFPPRLDVVDIQHELAFAPTLFLLTNPSTGEGAFYLWQHERYMPTGGFYEVVSDKNIGPIIPWSGNIPGGMEWLTTGVAATSGPAASAQIAPPKTTEPVDNLRQDLAQGPIGEGAASLDRSIQWSYPPESEPVEPATRAPGEAPVAITPTSRVEEPTQDKGVPDEEAQTTTHPAVNLQETPRVHARQTAKQQESTPVEAPSNEPRGSVARPETQITGRYPKRPPASSTHRAGVYQETGTAQDAGSKVTTPTRPERATEQISINAKGGLPALTQQDDMPYIRSRLEKRSIQWAAIAFLLIWALLGLGLCGLLLTQGRDILAKFGYADLETIAFTRAAPTIQLTISRSVDSMLDHPGMLPRYPANQPFYQSKTHSTWQ